MLGLDGVGWEEDEDEVDGWEEEVREVQEWSGGGAGAGVARV